MSKLTLCYLSKLTKKVENNSKKCFDQLSGARSTRKLSKYTTLRVNILLIFYYFGTFCLVGITFIVRASNLFIFCIIQLCLSIFASKNKLGTCLNMREHGQN